MQKIFAGLFGILWTGLSYQAGKVSQNQEKITFSHNPVHIQHPQPKGLQSPAQPTLYKAAQPKDTFIDGLIEPPFRTVTYPHFKVLYSTYHKCPLAVHQKFTKELADGDAPRRSTFFKEKTIDEQFQSTSDHFIKAGAYKNFYLARGHMAAAGNYSGDKQAKFMTFTYANVVPQNQHNNGGIWNTFERYTRELVMTEKCNSVEVINGPIYYKGNSYQGEKGEKYENVYQEKSIVLTEDGMMVPEKLYKIIKCNTKDGSEYMDAFQFWNRKTLDNDKPLKEFKTTIQKLESQTGLKFNFAKTKNGKINIKSLIDFDKEGMEKHKRTYDEKFYTKLITNSKTVEDMANAFRRAKEQQIFVSLQQFKEQTQRIFKQDIEVIKANYEKNKEKQACKALKDLVTLNKSLKSLKQLNSNYEAEIENVQNSGPLEQCHQKANTLRTKKWEDLSSEEEGLSVEKQEKISLNSVTYAVTKALKKREEQVVYRAAPVEEGKTFRLVNEEKLMGFVIPVSAGSVLVDEKSRVQIVTQSEESLAKNV